MTFLGLDIGTSAVKAVIVDEAEAVVAAAEEPLATRRPGPGLSEQDAALWTRAVEIILDRFAAELPGALATVARHRPFWPDAWGRLPGCR